VEFSFPVKATIRSGLRIKGKDETARGQNQGPFTSPFIGRQVLLILEGIDKSKSRKDQSGNPITYQIWSVRVKKA